MEAAKITVDHIEALVIEAANRIYDPCGLARGASIGLADMGLIRKVRVAAAPGARWNVAVTIRFTSPGCFYFEYFERRLEQELEHYPAIDLSVEWDDRLDWTPADLAPHARDQLAALRNSMV